MSLSVSNAEAGLLAAPCDEAKDDDKALFEAAKSFYDQTSDLTQHGAHNHPTDRTVLCDTAATLALEFAADGRSRPPTLTSTVILPGSGDTLAITVSAGGTPNYKIEHDGRAGSGAPRCRRGDRRLRQAARGTPRKPRAGVVPDQRWIAVASSPSYQDGASDGGPGQ